MATARVLTTSDLSGPLSRSLRSLLDEAFEGGFSDDDWGHTLGGWHVVVVEDDDDVPLAHAAVVPRALEVGNRSFRSGYVEGVATTPRRQREGLGSLAMTHAGRVIRANFELGALSTGHHRFYERLGWERWRGPTLARCGAALVRTEDDDDSVMVLRFGPSRELDLTQPISCDARTGDPW